MAPGTGLGGMLWGFAFFLGGVLDLLLIALIIGHFTIKQRFFRPLQIAIGSAGIATGFYLTYPIVEGTNIIEKLITGFPDTWVILFLFGSPAILGAIAIGLALD